MSSGIGLRGKTLLMKAAEAEARRKIIITALALEHFHKRHHYYPKSLNELVPDFLSQPPEDFMDGNPLRYQVKNQSFQLWSVGLDCVDDGGSFPEEASFQIHPEQAENVRILTGGDIVWPAPLE